MEHRGTLLSWNDEKGFGFIQPEDGSERLFVHISAMRGDSRPQAGETVLFTRGADAQGRPLAEHMRVNNCCDTKPAKLSIKLRSGQSSACTRCSGSIG